MVYAIFGLALGIALGAYLPVFPQVYSKLVAVAFMASLDAGFGGLRAVKEGNVTELPSSPYFNIGYSPIGKKVFVEEVASFLEK